MNNYNNYYNKYLKYKNKYSQLKSKYINKKGGDGNILFENIVGDINPNKNPITLSKDSKTVQISDHYLLYKQFDLDGGKKINLFDINISQLYQFKTKIKNYVFFNTMRSEKNLEFMYANKKNIIDSILEISKDNIDLLKNENFIKIKNLYLKKISDSEFFDFINLSSLKINIVIIKPSEAKKHILENLVIDPDTDSYYTFDIEFNLESLKNYKERIKNFFILITEEIRLLGDSLKNNYLIINIQELCPLDKILNLFNNFINYVKRNLDIDLELIYSNSTPIDSENTYSLSIVSTNTNYQIDYSYQNDNLQDDILNYIINQKNNLFNKNFKMVSSVINLPPIYNFHTGMFYHDDFKEFISQINIPDNFIICGDLNLKLDLTGSIQCIKKIAKSKNILLELCATPEANYPINNYTYDVIMYRL
jgi:hypothetical protein